MSRNPSLFAGDVVSGHLFVVKLYIKSLPLQEHKFPYAAYGT